MVAKLFITMPLTEPAAWATASYTYQNLQIGLGTYPRAQHALLQSTHPPCDLITDHFPHKLLLWTHFRPGARYRRSYMRGSLWGGNLSRGALIPRTACLLMTGTWPKSCFRLQARSYSNKATLPPDCHSYENRTHAGLWPSTQMQSEFPPQCTNTRSVMQEENTEKEKPANYSDGIYLFQESPVQGLVSRSR